MISCLCILYLTISGLAIGIAEGIATAAVVSFVLRARPDILKFASDQTSIRTVSIKKVLIGFIVASVIMGGAVSWFASTHPDGLEWAMLKTAGTEELDSQEKGVHKVLSNIREKTARLPDYSFKTEETESAAEPQETWPSVSAGTTVSGLIGVLLTVVIVIIIGIILKFRKTRI